MARLLMVTPDNEEVEVEEKDAESALKQGLEPALEYVDKQGQVNVVRRRDQKAAEQAGLKQKVLFDAEQQVANDVRQPGKVESAARGFANAGTFGFADEIGGAGQALLKAFQKGSLGDLKKDYVSERDRYRKEDDAAYQNNKLLYGAGAIAPTVATLGASAPVAAGRAAGVLGTRQAVMQGAKEGLKQGAAYGALSGLGGGTDTTGQSDVVTDKGASIAGLLDLLKSGTTGAAIGGVTGGALGTAVPAVVGGGKQAKQTFQESAKAFKKGAAEAPPGLRTIEGIQNVLKTRKGVREADEELAAALGQVNPLEELYSQTPNKVLNYLEDHTVMSKGGTQTPLTRTPLNMDKGESRPIGFMADEAGSFTASSPKPKVSSLEDTLASPDLASRLEQNMPGAFVAKPEGESVLSKILKLNPEERVAARGFDPKETAKSIQKDVDDALRGLSKNKSSVYTKYQKQAEEGFVPQEFERGLSTVKAGLEDAQQAGAGSISAVLDRARKVLEEGRALASRDIQRGAPDLANPPDLFKRTQKAREILDDAMRSTTDQESVRYLRNIRGELDDVLKSSPGKRKADEIYAQAKENLDAVLNPIMTKDKKIDSYKLARTFADTDVANRFRDNIEKLKKFVGTYETEFDPKQMSSVKAVLQKLDSINKVSSQKRDLNQLRFVQGPSSPAIERAQAALERKGVPPDILKAPAGVLNQTDNFLVSNSRKYFGKSFDKLEPEEKKKLFGMLDFINKNPDATDQGVAEAFQRILKGKQ